MNRKVNTAVSDKSRASKVIMEYALVMRILNLSALFNMFHCMVMMGSQFFNCFP
jgi:hypothetical protein